MKAAEININQAQGLLLCHEINLGKEVLEFGHVLTDADIVLLKQNGFKKILAATMEPTDISAETALGIIAAKLCGENTGYTRGRGALCKITAGKDGVFIASDDRIAKFNRHADVFRLNTVEVNSQVAAGEIIAELETSVPLIDQKLVDEIIFSLSGNTELLSVGIPDKRKTALIYSRFYNNAAETKHFTNAVKTLVKNFSAMQLDFTAEYDAVHSVEGIGDALERALADGNQVVFIIPGNISVAPEDVVPIALNSYVDEIVCQGIPQVGAPDLLIAAKRNCKIIVLPYHYGKVSTRLADAFIKHTLMSEKLNKFDFERPQNVIAPAGRKLEDAEKDGMIFSAGHAITNKEANVAAVILAAGTGSRSGRNKLLIECGGEPLFLKAVHAAVKSKASPVFVVTGHQADILEEFLEEIDVNIVYNPAFRSGIKTSIDLGLKSIPGFCNGAILLPADMPNITEEHLNKLIKKFDKNEPRQLCCLMKENTKYNPVLWSKELYPVADIVPENANIRPVFMEHIDYTKWVTVKNPNEVLDVNFPSDLEKLPEEKAKKNS